MNTIMTQSMSKLVPRSVKYFCGHPGCSLMRTVSTKANNVRCEPELTHVGSDGQARMVDVSDKATSKRSATATATVDVGNRVFEMIKKNEIKHKGDVLKVAQIAAIQAAKQTCSLIPLCHQVPLAHVGVSFRLVEPNCVVVTTKASTTAQTGVEMEALTAASVAALTVYDMCKAANKGIVVRDIRLLEKSGGKSKDYRAISAQADGSTIEKESDSGESKS